MSEELIKIKQEVTQKFTLKYNQKPSLISIAPGRINVIGEHTDYNFGLSMPAAINRWVVICFAFRDDNVIKMQAESFQNEMVYEAGKPFEATESWMKFMHGALEIFQRTDKITKGFNAYIWGNVPLGSGVSSSAALEVATMGLLRKAFNASFDDVTLVKNCQKIEHEYLGVKSGLLDQYASQLSKAGNLMSLDFQSLTHNYFSAEIGEYCWVLVNTKVKRELAGSKYSERVEETQAALKEIQAAKSTVKHFRDITISDVELLKNPTVKSRMKHFVTEDQRVFDTADAFKANNLKKVGQLLLESHYSLKNDYEVSCQELDFLVEKSKTFDGFLGGRMMGGGFGGCTINLIQKSKLKEFEAFILPAYKSAFNIDGEVYAFDMVDGACVENL
ncbi:MAG: galactokinase [Cytophagales bacterium]|nr:MAG: galactokinase [Cytophagales bacterium]